MLYPIVWGIDIVDREQWGADPSYLYVESDYWQHVLDSWSGYTPSQRDLNIHAYVTKTYPDYFTTTSGIELWDAKELVTPVKHIIDVQRLVIHHTASVFGNDDRTEQQFIQDIYKYHALKNKWGDIGYNFIIGPSGAIYEGRLGGGKARGFHASWNNEHSIGIALVGNFDLHEPTREQLLSLIRLSLYLKQQYNIQESDYVKSFRTCRDCDNGVEVTPKPWFLGHRHVGHTSCPGKHLETWIPAIKRFIESK